MIRLDAVVAMLPGLHAAEVSDWIARGWVRPQGEKPDWVFAELDVARVRLVYDLRVAAGVEVDSLSLVLSLLDQVRILRNTLHALAEGLGEQPEWVQKAVLARVQDF
jgi:hypothetical protein